MENNGFVSDRYDTNRQIQKGSAALRERKALAEKLSVAVKFSRIWVNPKDAQKPIDTRLEKPKKQTDENH